MGISKHVCIALFGGTGERFGAPYPKQFVTLGDEPMLIVTLRGLSRCVDIDEIYVVAEPSSRDDVYNLILAKQVKKVKAILKGGPTRQDSARLALEFLKRSGTPNDAIVMIADGDRPCVDPDLVHRCYAYAEEVGASVAAIPMSESVLCSQDGKRVSAYLDRSTVYTVQTPQTFLFSLIYAAHQKFKKRPVTDDASLVSLMHKPIAIVPGNKENIKITVPEDVAQYLAWKAKRKA
ncbi:MAG: 2-C-methyl-D-erythritol 4-phosphate cytidylyltransferase [Bacilli bacterium]|nr:2-C-methyl-D-erythritol 4-phosphate cytidylyltransferase [Bacilli bacterium]